MTSPTPGRRKLLSAVAGAMGAAVIARHAAAIEAKHPERAWYLEARRMQQLAESWGDQSYGAVVVAQGKVLGYGPSRVVRDQDPDAHAERVAIRDARLKHASSQLVGAVLYSTSRPCLACEQAAGQAGILRMYFGEALQDAGVPRVR